MPQVVFGCHTSGDQSCSGSLAALYDTTDLTKQEGCAGQSSVSQEEKERMGEGGSPGLISAKILYTAISNNGIHNFSDQRAFICNHDSHWLTVRKLGLQVCLM
jgi:hypothetical protein